MAGRLVEVLVVDGVEGKSVYLDNTRVAGTKPWGGWTVLLDCKCELSEILGALGVSDQMIQEVISNDRYVE